MKKEHGPIKRFKQILCSTLAIAMCVTALSGSSMAVAWAADEDNGSDAMYTVSIRDSEHGHLAFAGTDDTQIEVAEGDTVEFDVLPDDGYTLSDLLIVNRKGEIFVDGIEEDLLGMDSYSFTMPDESLIIEAAFDVDKNAETTSEDIETDEEEPVDTIEATDVATDAVLESYISENADAAYVGEVTKMEVANGLMVKNTLFDGEYVKKSDTIDSVMGNIESGDEEAIAKYLAQVPTYVAVYDVNDESDYFVADANTMKDDATVQDYCFAVNDNSGTVLDGCVYDKKTGLAYIPKKMCVVDGEYMVGYVQLQLMQVVGCDYTDMDSEVTSSVLGKDSADVYETVENIFSMETTVQTEAGLNEKNMVVSMNGIPLDDSAYDYDKATGEITIEQSSGSIGTIAVTVEKETIVSKIKDALSPISAYAASSFDDMESLADDIELPEWVVAGTALSGTAPMTYDSTQNRNKEYDHYPAYGFDWSLSGSVNEGDMDNLIDIIMGDWYASSWKHDWGAKFGDPQYYTQVSYDIFEDILFGSHSTTSGSVTANLKYDTKYLASGYNRYGGDTEPIGENIQDIDDLGFVSLMCVHSDTALGSEYVSPGTWINGNVFIRFLYVDRSAGVATFAIVTTQMDTQSGTAIAKIGIDSTGYLTLQKKSSNTSITDGNNCYSFDGAVYWVYEDIACTTRAKDADGNYAVLTTDANGHANTIEMEPGTYYAKEVTAPKGYILEEDYDADTAVHVVNVTVKNREDSPATITVTECPANDPGNIILYKEDAQTGEAFTQGSATLEGAQFTVCYYDYDGEDYETYVEENEPLRTWVIETKEDETSGNVYAKIGDDWKVSGDDFYYDENGVVTLPLGTYTIQETKAPEGYLIQGDFVYSTSNGEEAVGSAGDVFVTQLLYEDDLIWEKGGNYYTQQEWVKRGDFEFEKKNGETQERMANIPFSITSVTTGESHIVYTDENGYYSTSANYIPHSENTNSDEPDSGVWFGLNSSGENVEVDDTVGALPYDKYVVEELPCDENDGMEMISFTVTVSRDNWLIDYGTEENWPKVMSIHTMAWSGDTGTQICYADGYVTLYDDVYYTGLTVGEEYYIYGVALDADTREPEYDHNGEKISALTSFTALTEDGIEVQEFYFDVEDLSGHRVVFYETIYQIDEDGNAVLVMAEDPDDYANETIYFPQVETVLTDADTGEHYTARDGEITFVDTVSVTEVPAGTEATVIGTLMRKSTGEPLLDENGDPVTAQITYTSTGLTSNIVEITFSYDVSDVIGDTVVAFEDLYIEAHNREYDGTDDGETGELVLVGRHADLDDTDQSVDIKTPGSINTSMTNGPKTSDIILMVVFAAVLAAAIVAIVVVLVQRKRKMAEQGKE